MKSNMRQNSDEIELLNKIASSKGILKSVLKNNSDKK